jgi:hypothetical protein
MRAIALSLEPPRGAFKASPDAVRASGKTSGDKDLGAAPREFTKTSPHTPPRLNGAAVSHGGTGSFDPFWDGPRLVPAFVAQLLGQMTPEPGAPSACAAYSVPEPRMARLLDRRS